MIKKILITLTSTILFGLIDGGFFLFAEEKIQTPLKNNKYFDETSAEIMTGGISGACALLFAKIIEEYISHHFKIIENPLLDGIGVLIGAFITVILYNLFIKKKNKDNKDNNNNK